MHYAAASDRTNTELIQVLLNHMTIDSINKEDNDGETPLDFWYEENETRLRQEIFALLRSKGPNEYGSVITKTPFRFENFKIY